MDKCNSRQLEKIKNYLIDNEEEQKTSEKKAEASEEESEESKNDEEDDQEESENEEEETGEEQEEPVNEQGKMESKQEESENEQEDLLSLDNESDKLSIASDDIPITTEKGSIYTFARVERREGKILIKFNISPARPKTKLNGQGDHVTSYIAILLSIIISTNEQNIINSIDKLKNLYRKLFNEEYPHELYKEYGKNERKETINFIRKLLKLKGAEQLYQDYLSKIPQIDNFDQNNFCKKISSTIKYEKVSFLTNYLNDLASEIVIRLQRTGQITTVFSRGRKNKPSSEGSNAKKATWVLSAVNYFCDISTNLDNLMKMHALDQLKSKISPSRKSNGKRITQIIRYGLNALLGEKTADILLKTLNSEDASLEDQFAAVLELKNKLISEREELATHMNSLYDYLSVLEFDLKKAFPVTNKSSQIDKELFNKDKKKFYEKKLKIVFEENNETKKDIKIHVGVENKIYTATVERTSKNNLIITLSNYFIIIEAAFPSLQQEPQYKDIKLAFLKKMLKQSGWDRNNFIKWGLNEVTPESIADILISELENKAKISDSEQIFQEKSADHKETSKSKVLDSEEIFQEISSDSEKISESEFLDSEQMPQEESSSVEKTDLKNTNKPKSILMPSSAVALKSVGIFVSNSTQQNVPQNLDPKKSCKK